MLSELSSNIMGELSESFNLSDLSESIASLPATTYYGIGAVLLFFVVAFLFRKIAKGKSDSYRAGQVELFKQKSAPETQKLLDSLFAKHGVLRVFQDAVKDEKIAAIRQIVRHKDLADAAKE
jgi:hypothetical protein